MDAVSCEPAHMVAAFRGHLAVFNMETQQRVLTMEAAGPPGEEGGGGANHGGRQVRREGAELTMEAAR